MTNKAIGLGATMYVNEKHSLSLPSGYKNYQNVSSKIQKVTFQNLMNGNQNNDFLKSVFLLEGSWFF